MQTASNGIKRDKSGRFMHIVVRATTIAASCLVVGSTAAWALAMAWITARANITAPGPASADELLALAAATLALAIATWLVLGTILEVLAHVPGRVGRAAQVWADRLTPALARRMAAFVLGVGVGVVGGPSQAVANPRPATAATSVADPGFVPTLSASDVPLPDPGFTTAPLGPGLAPVPTVPAPSGAAPESAAPGFTPTAPRVRPQADPGLLGSRPGTSTERDVVVHRGDSLWSIAARHLGPQATDAEIAREWPRWFDLNRDLIGDDPDLILPGQILRVPGADQTASVHR
jgi:hypothetical protein